MYFHVCDFLLELPLLNFDDDLIVSGFCWSGLLG